MTLDWPHWLRPGWWLLLPLMAGLLWYRSRNRLPLTSPWQRLLPVKFQERLLIPGKPASQRPLLLLATGWLLALLALLGPARPQLPPPTARPADPLVVLLEVTPDMLARDVQPDRLGLARHKLLDLLQLRHGASTAIVVFAGSAHVLVPLTEDQSMAGNLLQAVSPAIMPEAGHRADLAVEQALGLLRQAGQGPGHLLLMGGSLQPEEQLQIRALLERQATPLAILGIGSRDGAPVTGEDGRYLRTASGAILMPHLNPEPLARLAEQLGGRYRTAGPDPSDLLALQLQPLPDGLHDTEPAPLPVWRDEGHWLLLPLVLVAACAARRGWLFGLLLLVMGTPVSPAMASSWQDLWWRPDQQALQQLEAGQPLEAAKNFQNFRWRGLAFYQAGHYAAAARCFAMGQSAADRYNLGNALAMDRQLEPALAAYDQALNLQPGWTEAEQNRAIVAGWLQKRDAGTAETRRAGHEGTAREPPPGGPDSGPQPQPPADGNRPATRSSQPSPPATAAGRQPEASGQLAAGTRSDARNGQLETRQVREQWLRLLPDNPGELLKRKFLYEQRQRQESLP